MLRSLPLIALLITGASASSWGSLLDRRHPELHDHVVQMLSPPVPSLVSNALRGHVWEPVLPSDAVPPTGKVAGVLDLKFRYINDMQGDYATTVYVGTPPQPVSLLLSIPSSDLIVLNHKIDTHRFYDHTKSSSYVANGTHFNYGDLFSGYTSRDVVTIGDPDAKHTIEASDFLFLELKGRDDVLEKMAADGFIGFGPHAAGITGAPSFVRTMVTNKVIDEPVVGLYFGEHEAHALVGGVDSMYVDGAITYYPLPTNHSEWWSVPVTGVSVGGKPLDGPTRIGLLASSSFIAGPKEQVEAIADTVGAQNNVLPCDGPGPDIVFRIGKDLQVTLTKKDYAQPTKQEGVCLFAFFAFPSTNDSWYLGNIFMRKVYTVLKYGDSESESSTGIALSHPSPFN